MTYRGHIDKGTIVLDEAVKLPDGAIFRIELTTEIADVDDDSALSFSERYKEVIGKARSLPEDASEDHDHYLYGVLKN